jgi:cellulose synthase/poly-beta-1,6-N-acetylglucosamine synthase-like glycosyltransferase
MVTGVAPYYRYPGLLNSFIRHEYLWNIILSAGSISLGHGTHACGRNLGFRRNIFHQTGGYGAFDRVLSGDDTLLLHSIQRHGRRKVVTMPDKSTHVYTKAPGHFKEFLHQRMRHMSTGKFFNPFHILIGCIVYGFHILLVSSLFLSLFSIHYFAVFCTFFLWKTGIDSLAALRAHRYFSLEVQWKRFFLNELLLLIYMTCMPIAGFFAPVRWK